MGLLSRLRAWITGSTGDGESAASETESKPGAAGDTAESDTAESDDGDDPTGLDPSAATETRTAATDDAVDALRDVRRSQEAVVDDEAATSDETDELAAEPDGNDRNAS